MSARELRDEEPTHLAEPDRRELVAEAAMTFGEAAAGELAAHLGLSLADAAGEIARLRHHDRGARRHG